MLSLKLAARALLGRPRATLLLLGNLCLGLLAFVLLDAFKASVDTSVSQKSQAILAADLSVSARRELTPDELKTLQDALPPGSRTTALRELFSMIAAPNRSRLVEIQAINPGYPFYGSLVLEPGGELDPDSEFLLATAVRDEKGAELWPAWLDPNLARITDLKVGDRFKLGGANFQVAALTLQDSADSTRGFSFATRVYISQRALDASGLLRQGSTQSFKTLVKLPGSVAPERATELARRITKILPDPAIRVSSHRDASESLARGMGLLNDYLGLVSVIALFLSGLGTAYLVRAGVSARLPEIATLIALGRSRVQSIVQLMLELVLLSSLAALLSYLAVWSALPALIQALEGVLPFSVVARVPVSSLFIALGVSVLSALLSPLPLFLSLRRVQVQGLFQGELSLARGHFVATLVATGPAALAFWAISIFQAHSFKVGSLFALGFLISGLLLLAIARGGLSLLSKLELSSMGFVPRYGLRSAIRHPGSTVASFLALGLGAMLLTLVPQVEKSLQNEIERPELSKIPSLFLFDIQPDQKDGITQFFEERGVPIFQMSAFIRARLKSINGAAFEKDKAAQDAWTREEEQEARFRNRGFNLTYRGELTESETITEGAPFSGPYKGSDPLTEPAEVSIETRFAERLGLKLGDLMLFDIQGVEVAARVINLRQVKWTSFRPNFFVQFPDGVLEEAPQTFLAAVSGAAPEKLVEIQTEMLERYPNVSAVDVGAVARRLSELFAQMGWAIRVLAFACILSALFILAAIAAHQAESRRKELLVLKAIGAHAGTTLRASLFEFVAIAFAAGVAGSILSLVLGAGTTWWVFESAWQPELSSIVWTVLGVSALSALVASLPLRSATHASPAELFSELGGQTGGFS